MVESESKDHFCLLETQCREDADNAVEKKDAEREEAEKEGLLQNPSIPQPLPRRDIDTYRLTVPTYNSTTMDPLRSEKA